MKIRIATTCAFAYLLLAATASAGEHLVITAVGDVNLGTDFPSTDFLPPDGGQGLLAPVADRLEGDVVFGNLEGPLLDGGETHKCGRSGNCYAFRTPTAYAKNLKAAGFTVMGLANNHALDFGDEGRTSSMAQLDTLGIAHSGKPGDVANLEVKGKKIALVAFTSSAHSHNLLEIDKAADLVKKLDADHDLVIVSFHGGSEGSRAVRVPDAPEFLGREPRGHLIQFAHAVVDAGADLVIGHGPHVLRGLEVYRGRLIAYSLGNFCTYGRFNLRGALGRAVVLTVELKPETGEFAGGELFATIQHKPGGAKPDPEGGGIADVRKLTRLDFPLTGPRIGEDGKLSPGPSMGHGLLALNSVEDREAVAGLIAKLEKKKFGRDDLIRWFGDERAALAPKVIERFRRPAEKIFTYPEYRKIFIKPAVLERGKVFLKERADLLAKVEKKYAVEREAVAGIIATETKFGTHRGTFRVFNALATQALKMKRRQRWATAELVALFKVFEDDPLAIMGSYAGAVGLVQFMPTSIQRYGQDWDQDGKIDLDGWADALASCANYLKGKGWKLGGPIERGKANYKAIFRYNPSHHYARVVGELAHAFGYPKPEAKGKKAKKDEKAKKEVKAKKEAKAGKTEEPAKKEKAKKEDGAAKKPAAE